MAQQKGGAGKTTLVAQLSVALAAKGARVALIDIDPQGSLCAWHRTREAEAAPLAGKGTLALASVSGWRTQATVDRLKAENDLVLIDSAPHAETEAKIAIRAADLVLVPIQPSPMDLWATEPTLALIRAEKRRPLLVLNRTQSRLKLAEALGKKIAALEADLARASIGNRTAFAASMLAGRGVVETDPGSKAAAEIGQLAREVTRLLGKA